jgi:AcrR family transcriptional regulator
LFLHGGVTPSKGQKDLNNPMEPLNKATKKSNSPRQRRKEARPAELIEAGLAEFAEHGFAGARLEDVAKRAGVVKGTIYRYFKDKEALFEAVVRAKVPPFMAPVEDMVDSFPGTTEELLAFVVHGIHAEITDSSIRVLMRIIIAEGPRFPELVKLYYDVSVGRGFPILQRIIERGVARGEIHADYSKRLPMMIAAPAVMASIWHMTFGQFEQVPPQEFLEAHLELIRRGVLKKKSGE